MNEVSQHFVCMVIKFIFFKINAKKRPFYCWLYSLQLIFPVKLRLLNIGATTIIHWARASIIILLYILCVIPCKNKEALFFVIQQALIHWTSNKWLWIHDLLVERPQSNSARQLHIDQYLPTAYDSKQIETCEESARYSQTAREKSQRDA